MGSEEYFQILFKAVFEFEGIEGLVLELETVLDLRSKFIQFQQSLIRSLWVLIGAFVFAALLLLVAELEGGMKMVLEQIPVFIDLVHQGHQRRLVKAVVTKELSHMGPVLLFAMGVVVLAVGPTSGNRMARPVQILP